MPNPYFHFKQFTIYHDRCSMKVTTDSCLFGAWAAESISRLPGINNILDIGSGSGLLSLMLAQKTAAMIEGIEIQESDYLQSADNISRSSFRTRVSVHHSDAVTFPYHRKYDILISNPPFYEADLKGGNRGKNIAHHDEGLQLQGLLGIIQQTLSPQGHFYLLLPARRQEALKSRVPLYGIYINETVSVHQTEKHPAFRIMVKGSFKETTPVASSLEIKNGEAYTPIFTRLLKDYYRHL